MGPGLFVRTRLCPVCIVLCKTMPVAMTAGNALQAVGSRRASSLTRLAEQTREAQKRIRCLFFPFPICIAITLKIKLGFWIVARTFQGTRGVKRKTKRRNEKVRRGTSAVGGGAIGAKCKLQG